MPPSRLAAVRVRLLSGDVRYLRRRLAKVREARSRRFRAFLDEMVEKELPMLVVLMETVRREHDGEHGTSVSS